MNNGGFRTDAEVRKGMKDEGAIALILARQDAYRAAGWRYRIWRPTSPGSPGVVWDHAERTGYYYRDFDHIILPRVSVMDHEYRLISPAAGADRTGARTIWVTEPYMTRCNENVAAALSARLGVRWHVRYFPEGAIWYPGHTVALWIARLSVPLEAPWERRAA